MRAIVTKYRIYELASDAQGVPVEEYFAGVTLPKPLKGSGAKVYHTADGPVSPCQAAALSVQHENRANQKNLNPDCREGHPRSHPNC